MDHPPVTAASVEGKPAPRAARVALRLGLAVTLMSLALGCRATQAPTARLAPSHDRQWQALLSQLPKAERDGDTIRVHNVRNCHYFREDVYAVRFERREYRLSELRTVDFVVVPFQEAPNLAHTMLSFGFADGQFLGVSVEARLEEGEVYSPVGGMLNQFELIYVLADERDLIALRTEHRDADVYLYRTKVTPPQARKLLVDVLQRVNQIEAQPEFYHTLTNNCTTNIVDHVNGLRPGSIPLSLARVLTGHSDRLAYDLGLLETSGTFESARQAALINELSHRYYESADFSQRIRR